MQEEEEAHVDLLERDELIKRRWKVRGKVGGGGFGDVFIGWDKVQKIDVAIKAEDKDDPRETLHMEVAVLKRLQGKNHAAKFYGCGQTSRAYYVVMQLLSRNLSQLRRDRKEGKFSPGTAYRLCLQALEAIREVHSIGFLHRDVKPSNFSMGLTPEDNRTVFILDFGLCRQFVDKQGEILRPRKYCRFRGTVRYCSLTAHYRMELGRADDLESLFYMIIEMVNGALPWRRLTEQEPVMQKKQEASVESLCEHLPPQILEFGRHLAKVPWLDQPDYDLLEGYLRCAAYDETGINPTSNFDWEDETEEDTTSPGDMKEDKQSTDTAAPQNQTPEDISKIENSQEEDRATPEEEKETSKIENRPEEKEKMPQQTTNRHLPLTAY